MELLINQLTIRHTSRYTPYLFTRTYMYITMVCSECLHAKFKPKLITTYLCMPTRGKGTVHVDLTKSVVVENHAVLRYLLRYYTQ